MYVYGPDFDQIYQNRLASEGRSVQVMQSHPVQLRPR